MSAEIQVGSRVRSFDVPSPLWTAPGARDSFVEGIVEAVGLAPQYPDGLAHYTIRATRRVANGEVVEPEAEYFFPVVNGTPTTFGPANGVELLDEHPEVVS